MLTHLTNMYAFQGKESRDALALNFDVIDDKQLDSLVEAMCTEPDEAAISEDEVRLFLNGHFMAARALSKLFTSVIANMSRTKPTVLALKKYQWLEQYAKTLCQAKGISVDDVFKEELMICSDMVQLLPSKIDRMFYLGEGGMTI